MLLGRSMKVSSQSSQTRCLKTKRAQTCLLYVLHTTRPTIAYNVFKMRLSGLRCCGNNDKAAAVFISVCIRSNHEHFLDHLM